ncbi:dual OB domain-containing protein [Pseudomonas sp. NPDC096950]|uniref:dual OB domain-containing protein n=1 Tax=Pseudomonas sp. NPDC096950 TaxID=3364485 RepID=UPI003839D8FE
MSYSKTFICLACSRKPDGRCVAGKELVNGAFGGWIRPVTPGGHSAVTNDQRKYPNGYSAVVLDYVTAEFTKQETGGFQSENHLILEPSQWKLAGKEKQTKQFLAKLVDAPASLWTNTCTDSLKGLNDRVSVLKLTQQIDTLYLIPVTDLIVHVEFIDEKRKVRGEFVYNGVQYRLKITDPKFEQLFDKAGKFDVSIEYLTISLGEPFEGFAYKLIAAVF